MLKLNKINYGFAEYGPPIGHPIIDIFFEVVDEIKDYDLYKDFKEILSKDATLQKAYERSINGSVETYLQFNGPECISTENSEQFDGFYSDISHESVEIQKNLRDAGLLEFGKIRPPFMLWTGKPSYSAKNLYEYFNIPYAVLRQGDKYQELGLAQVMQHAYGNVFVVYTGNGKDDEFIKNFRKVYKSFKCVVISDLDHREEARKYCLENGYVYYTAFNLN